MPDDTWIPIILASGPDLMDMVNFISALTCVCHDIERVMDSYPTDFIDKKVRELEEFEELERQRVAKLRHKKEVEDCEKEQREEYEWRLSLVADLVSDGVVSEIKQHSENLAGLLGRKPGCVLKYVSEWKWECTQAFIDAGLVEMAAVCCPAGGLGGSRDLATHTQPPVDGAVRVEARSFVLSCLVRLGLLQRGRRTYFRAHVGMLDTLVQDGVVGLHAQIPEP